LVRHAVHGKNSKLQTKINHFSSFGFPGNAMAFVSFGL
jgi:hypothetical protein